jgi:WD40 repeat protein/transcriptional regulator with XRE-family HTH domain
VFGAIRGVIGVDLEGLSGRAEFAAALSELRGRSGLSVRELAKRLGVPHSTIGDWFAGGHVPSTTQMTLFRQVLEACGAADPEPWLAALHRVRGASDRRISRAGPPYRGLKPFETADAPLFFGRDEETAAILNRIRELRTGQGPAMLAVVGPSGSGKSSLLRAGVIAALQAEAVPCALATPTQLSAVADEPDVLVLDQFEESFTHLDSGARRRLLEALAHRRPGTVVVLGLRADFYAAASREPALLPALQNAQVVVGPLDRDRVRAAITRPAAQAGMSVEDGLVEVILGDLAPHDAPGIAHDPGALPLLSHALLATWERARGSRLTLADYRASGGIEQGIQRSADEVFASLDSSEQALARRLFLRLVNVAEEAQLTRRRISRPELAQLGVGTDAVTDRFVDRRLLTVDRDTVQVSHEALLSAWPRLRDWIDADRAGLRLHRQLTDAAHAWQDADRDTALLLRGTRLDAAIEWAAGHGESTELEREFVSASRAQAVAEHSTQQRQLRRLRRMLAALGVLAAVAVASTVVTLHATSVANDSRRKATQTRDQALSRQVAIESRDLASADPALAQQLALAAYRIWPTTEARSALLDQSARPLITRVLGGPGPTPLAVSPDGALAAVGHGDDGSIHLYRLRGDSPPLPLATLHGPPGSQVYALAAAGQLLAAGGTSKAVQLWDVADPRHPSSIATLAPAFRGAVQSIAVSPDGRTVAAASSGTHPVQEWDITDPASPRALPAPPGIPAGVTEQAVAFSRDGDQLAAAGSDGALYLWGAARAGPGQPRTVKAAAGSIDALVFNPDGSQLFAGDKSGAITAWTLRDLRRARTLHVATNSFINALALSPDGSQLAAGSSDNTLTQWDTRTWAIQATTEHPGPVTGIGYTPDGTTTLSTAADGALRLWPANGYVYADPGSSVWSVAYTADGSRLTLADNGAQPSVRLWDARDPTHPAPLSPRLPIPAGDGTSAVRADGTLTAAGTANGQVALWDTSDPGHPRATTAMFKAAGALVENLAI